jgi:hypothetical protein
MFSEKGRYRGGTIGYPGYCSGEAWFDGGQLYLRDFEETLCCPPDEVGIWEVQGVPGEFLSLSIVDEPCGTRRGIKLQYRLVSSP